MVDRVIVYDAALTQSTDVLNTFNKLDMIGNAFLARAVLGGNTVVHGLACTPTAPASLQGVNVGAGFLFMS